jgi:hypothetical protein
VNQPLAASQQHEAAGVELSQLGVEAAQLLSRGKVGRHA